MARILVVDDEPDVRGLIRLVLELDGHTVEEAPHGLAALDAMTRVVPDVLMTDFMMPVMDGGRLIEAVRADAQLQRMPIIVVSASLHGVLAADIVMHKPFIPAELRSAVHRVLGSQAGATPPC